MNRINIKPLVVALFLIPACSSLYVEIDGKDAALTLSITADIPSAKVSFDSEGKSRWDSGDAINVFYSGTGAKFTTSQGGRPAVFTGVLPAEGSGGNFWGLYPYDAEASFSDGILLTSLPSSQTAIPGAYATNIKVACSSTTDLAFLNACGALKFRLGRSDIRSITLKSSSGTALSGPVSIVLSDDVPVTSALSEAADSVCMEPNTGTFRANEWYYMAVLPGNSDNFTLTFRTADKTASCTISGYNFKRNRNKVLDYPDSGLEWTDAPLYIWKADDVIRASIAAGTIPGGVLSVVKGREVIYHKAYGNKYVKPSAIPTTEDVVYDLASVTKPVSTTTCLMQLYEQGRVDLDANIGTYLTDFDPEEEITVKELLTHTSGLPNYQSYISTTEYAGKADEALQYIAASLPRLSKVYRYSCLNFFLCQRIVEAVTGERICDYAPANVFLPLGMTDTHFIPAGEEQDSGWMARVAPGVSTNVGHAQDGFAYRVCEGNGGNAGLFSTAADLSVFAIALLNGGEWNGTRILQESTVRLISLPIAYGRTLGWDNSSTASGVKGTKLSSNLICHTGYSGTFILVDFDNDLAIILLANRIHPSDTGYAALKTDRAKVCNAVAEALLQ